MLTLPYPVALAVVVLLAYTLWHFSRWPDQPVNPPRHSATSLRTAFVVLPLPDIPADVADEPATPEDSDLSFEVIAYDPLDHRIPLAEVERRMALTAYPFPVIPGEFTDQDTRELATVG